MMDCEIDQIWEKRKSTKVKLILKLIPYVQKHGFSAIKMDDVAKYMDISKATMYKYFASKDDIIECLVEKCVSYTESLMFELEPNQLIPAHETLPSHEDLRLYGESFAKVFKQSFKMSFYLSDILLQDLNTTYPDLAAALSQAVERCQMKLVDYLNKGMELGIFHQMNAEIILIQLDVVLRRLLDPKLLLQHNISLKQALLDFYQAMKLQLFHEKWLLDDQTLIEPFISEMIVKKLSYE
ncbi:TetR/AcrR family transcriptional regulator [Paenibacillus sinopodophylli]|uniref:TetR/AcrR family transcriptional regulator n=1 Tax=Paenibacillus sinopodophylli TaxID=1837342 RepID=UPI00110CB20A|nr:TetR/AcrR family transcriptional regulator [Paenibacillus sinopodophylli]